MVSYLKDTLLPMYRICSLPIVHIHISAPMKRTLLLQMNLEKLRNKNARLTGSLPFWPRPQSELGTNAEWAWNIYRKQT